MRTISYQLELDVLPWWRNVRADTCKSISKVYRQTCTMTLFQMLQTTMNAMAIVMVVSYFWWFGTRTIILPLYLEDVHIDKAFFYLPKIEWLQLLYTYSKQTQFYWLQMLYIRTARIQSSTGYNCCIRPPRKQSSNNYKWCIRTCRQGSSLIRYLPILAVDVSCYAVYTVNIVSPHRMIGHRISGKEKGNISGVWPIPNI